MILSYICPKRKCRHQWEGAGELVVNSDCPECGAKDLSPVDIQRAA